jgi:hypothetical protein
MRIALRKRRNGPRRVTGANRGVWESGWWLGPTVSVAHEAAEVDRYVGLFGEFLSDIM